MMDLDKVFLDIGGFGRYQVKRYGLICLVLIYATFSTLGYVFTARNLDYRCHIDTCEGSANVFAYEVPWLRHAVPLDNDGIPSRCTMYKSLSQDCNEASFDKNDTVRCEKFVYKYADESTILNDFNLQGDENLWKLTIVGSINNLGFLAGLPLAGYISDRFGRRTLMIFAILGSTVMGTIKSFSPNYIFFVIFEFLDMTLGSGTYTAAYILGMELLTPEYRVMCSTIMSSAFAMGEALMGLTAWLVPSWRIFLRLLYIPGLLFISCYWFTDESVRWMVSNNKIESAQLVLKKIASENGRILDEATVKRLQHQQTGSNDMSAVANASDNFMDLFQSPTLVMRLLNCSFAWICCTFVYYGLTMHSVGISGNIYINFIAVSVIEIPAYAAANILLNRLGRRTTQTGSFFLSGLACLGFVFTPESANTVRLIVFLFGKFSATVSYATIYLYTTEMFPTSLRHSFMSTCSMFGRIGSMVAPQIPILAKVSKSLPLILFAAMAGISGVFSLFFPETLNAKLPETLEDAIYLGYDGDNNNFHKIKSIKA